MYRNRQKINPGGNNDNWIYFDSTTIENIWKGMSYPGISIIKKNDELNCEMR